MEGSDRTAHIAALDERSADPNPVQQFRLWFGDAVKRGVLSPEAMTLATATKDGRPSARLVLLKGVDERGFAFFTNYRSRKGKELEENPRAALVFYWSEMGRQIRIEGSVERIRPEESQEYFRSRPRDSQVSAAASPQSEVVASRSALEAIVAETSAGYGNREIPCPPFWGGYRVKPLRIEFWQERDARLHDRILYVLNRGERWSILRLAP